RHKRFGAFMAPFHSPIEHPLLALERDLELLTWLDELAFDEAWIGEHHSAGWEYVASPELFLAVAAERTRHIKLGTGVVSLPYHHPLLVAERMAFLDNITRGRALFGVGPGALVTDALMLGVEPTRTRPMMDEALGVILRLFTETEPITVESDWFTLRNAVLHLRPYSRPYMPLAVASMQSPAGPVLAGKYGAGLLSIGVFFGFRGAVDLKAQWQLAEDAANESGRTVSRDEWRLVMPVHVAETRQEAIAQIHDRGTAWLTRYQRDVLGRPLPEGVPEEHAVEALVERGAWLVGTPDDCVAAIERLEELSGGFGGLLVMVQDWATREQLRRSYELLARYVIPRYTGALAGVEAGHRHGIAQRREAHQAMKRSIDQAFEARERTPANGPAT
ncbi:MAG TPA: LLM class flavin-dependent oxidoreductase, partial [Chloroflexota bacterium]|nr:LLM class flavin-dependent oxidoreductase [Chloroflexota bacterium]